jgi:hypothetical protein
MSNNQGDDALKQGIDAAMKQLHELNEVSGRLFGEIAKLQRAAVEAQMQRARESVDETHQQTKAALDNLDAAMKSGSEFLQKFLRGDK